MAEPETKEEKRKVLVREAWITDDHDLMVQMQDKRQLLLYGDALDFLLENATRDQKYEETDFPGVPICDADELDDAFALPREDAEKEIRKILEKHKVEISDKDDALVDDLVDALADEDGEDEGDDKDGADKDGK